MTKRKQKGSTRISEVSRNIYLLYSHGPSFHNASVKTVVREWVDSGPFSGRGFAEPLPSSNELGRFPVVKTAVPVHRRFEHIVLSCNEHLTTPSFGSNEKLSELSTFASAANVGEREENGDTREVEDGETRITLNSFATAVFRSGNLEVSVELGGSFGECSKWVVPFLTALLILLVVGELARLACTGAGSCLTVELGGSATGSPWWVRERRFVAGLVNRHSSVSVASRTKPVSFQGNDLGLSLVHFSDVVLACLLVLVYAV
ncbi:hypothetical protein Bca52824_063562 [Brassica carinata]|uniref:Uncharacterized protein n=1 Tax=Brassica carinata TaxID=52824 RepID=A0A8X7QGN0_BRACI|nr:hypothetical protein Bca52824_063562 [Brassica carinata]